MSDAVLDSSAVLAFILGEPGGDRVAKQINGALISSVNLAEVVGHFARFGKSDQQIRDHLRALPLVVVPFDETGAFETGLLRPLGERAGLSLGDRACLSLARLRSVPALTADRAWLGIGPAYGVEIEMIR